MKYLLHTLCGLWIMFIYISDHRGRKKSAPKRQREDIISFSQQDTSLQPHLYYGTQQKRQPHP